MNHWDVVPDIITAPRASRRPTLPLRRAGIRPEIAGIFEDNVFSGGLTYNTHPMSVAAALATIGVDEEET